MTINLLSQAFDLRSLSVYIKSDRLRYPRIRSGSPEATTFEEFYPHARMSEIGFMVKTHGRPMDDSPAIHIVRDGRSSVVSYWHFMRDIDQVDCTLQQVIKEKIGFGSWSDLLNNWDPLNRPHTLLLRYEDILELPDQAIQLISRFLNLKPTGTWRNDFSEMNRKQPLIYRTGSNARNIAELSQSDLKLFWKCHTRWMEKLGYDKEHYSFQSTITSIPASLPTEWYRNAKSRVSITNTA